MDLIGKRRLHVLVFLFSMRLHAKVVAVKGKVLEWCAYCCGYQYKDKGSG